MGEFMDLRINGFVNLQISDFRIAWVGRLPGQQKFRCKDTKRTKNMQMRMHEIRQKDKKTCPKCKFSTSDFQLSTKITTFAPHLTPKT